jgi:hypothetical protein
MTSGEPPQRYSDGVRIAPGGTQQGWNDVPGAPCSRDSVTVFTNNWRFQAAEQPVQNNVVRQCEESAERGVSRRYDSNAETHFQQRFCECMVMKNGGHLVGKAYRRGTSECPW